MPPPSAKLPSIAGAPSELAGIERVPGAAAGTVLRLKVGSSHLDLHGAVDAGVLFLLADTAVALEILRSQRTNCTTAEAKINILRQVSSGLVIATARILRIGDGLAVAEASLRCEGRRVAEALFTYALLPSPKREGLAASAASP